MIEETLCPKCESKMKPAKSAHGVYWRCTRWGCDGTRNLDGESKRDRERDEAEESESGRFRRRWE